MKGNKKATNPSSLCSAWIPISLLMIGLTTTLVLADTSSRLYKEYNFGMSKGDLLEDSRIYDCSDDFNEEGWYCLDNDKFADTTVSIAFEFSDESLVSVLLLSEFSRKKYMDLFFVLNSKMQLISMYNDEGTFDVVMQIQKMSNDTFNRTLNEFEREALLKGNITYAFIDRDVFEKYARGSVDSTDLVIKIDDNARTAEYTITEDGDGAFLVVRFSSPKRYMQLVQDKSTKDQNDF